MSKKFNHEDFSHWIFDLDNTLYPEDENIFPQVKKRIIEFISLEFQIDKVSANKKRQRLYNEYGTSLRGLMSENKINPDKFLEYVHDIDLSIIKVSDSLRQMYRSKLNDMTTNQIKYNIKK